jgi:hypothetical protein
VIATRESVNGSKHDAFMEVLLFWKMETGMWKYRIGRNWLVQVVSACR